MARVLVMETEAQHRDLFLRHLRDRHEVLCCEDVESGLSTFAQQQFDVVVVDVDGRAQIGWNAIDSIRALDTDVSIIVSSVREHYETARRALSIGALELFAKRWTNDDDLKQLDGAVERASNLTALRRRAHAASGGVERRARGQEPLLGASAAIVTIRQTMERFRDAELAVLLEGPTGAGKEVIAKTVHANSRFKDGPFIAINVPILSPELIASELFGHVRGAFTGAERDRIGAFEQANHGTLFLDEIGDMPLELQAKLLRALETKEIVRVGSERRIPLDLRIIAATHVPLKELVDQHRFRADLYFRLNHLCIPVPPLSERRIDIPVLAEYFLGRTARELGKEPPRFVPEALSALSRYPWPGNVRELKSVVERLLFSGGNGVIEERDVLRELPEVSAVSGTHSGSLRDRLLAHEFSAVRDALQSADGSIAQAALHSGESYQTFYARVRRLGLVPGKRSRGKLPVAQAAGRNRI